MKDKLILLSIILGTIWISITLVAQGYPITPIYGGGTGTSTRPNEGQLLIGDSMGNYTFVSSSNLIAATDTFFNLFSSVAPIVYDSSTGQFSWINSNNYISTSTFNVTGTPYQAFIWNMTGNAPLLNSSIFESSSTGDISINTSTDLAVVGGIANASSSALEILKSSIGTTELTVATSGALTANSTIVSNASMEVAGSSAFFWSGSNSLKSPSNGTIEMFNSAGTDFNELEFGGTSSSYLGLVFSSSTQTFKFRNAANSTDANMTAASGTFNGTLNVNGFLALTSSSTLITPSISGAIVGLGCDTATSSIDASIISSTATFITTPQNFPGAGLFWASYLSAPSVLTTEICSDVTVTPVATSYVVKIIK